MCEKTDLDLKYLIIYLMMYMVSNYGP